MRVITDIKPRLEYASEPQNRKSLGSTVFNIVLALVVVTIITGFAALALRNLPASPARSSEQVR